MTGYQFVKAENQLDHRLQLICKNPVDTSDSHHLLSRVHNSNQR